MAAWLPGCLAAWLPGCREGGCVACSAHLTARWPSSRLQGVNLRGSSVKKATPLGQQGLFRHIMDAQLALAPAGGWVRVLLGGGTACTACCLGVESAGGELLPPFSHIACPPALPCPALPLTAEVPRGVAQGMGPSASYLLLAICIRWVGGRVGG